MEEIRKKKDRWPTWVLLAIGLFTVTILGVLTEAAFQPWTNTTTQVILANESPGYVNVTGNLQVNSTSNEVCVNNDCRRKWDYTMNNLAENCTLKVNINVSNMIGVCAGAESPHSAYYHAEDNWSVYCCQFERDTCLDGDAALPGQVCEDILTDNLTSSIYYDNGWRSICCSDDRQTCYVDNDIQVNDNNTICDREYDLAILTLTHNTSWTGKCCLQGTR